MTLQDYIGFLEAQIQAAEATLEKPENVYQFVQTTILLRNLNKQLAQLQGQ